MVHQRGINMLTQQDVLRQIGFLSSVIKFFYATVQITAFSVAFHVSRKWQAADKNWPSGQCCPWLLVLPKAKFKTSLCLTGKPARFLWEITSSSMKIEVCSRVLELTDFSRCKTQHSAKVFLDIFTDFLHFLVIKGTSEQIKKHCSTNSANEPPGTSWVACEVLMCYRSVDTRLIRSWTKRHQESCKRSANAVYSTRAQKTQ